LLSKKLSRLRENAKEMQGQKVWFIDYLGDLEQLLFVIAGPFDTPTHLGDNGSGQVARRGQLEAAGIDRVFQQNPGGTGHR
jgi:hypothetical protein